MELFIEFTPLFNGGIHWEHLGRNPVNILTALYAVKNSIALLQELNRAAIKHVLKNAGALCILAKAIPFGANGIPKKQNRKFLKAAKVNALATEMPLDLNIPKRLSERSVRHLKDFGKTKEIRWLILFRGENLTDSINLPNSAGIENTLHPDNEGNGLIQNAPSVVPQNISNWITLSLFLMVALIIVLMPKPFVVVAIFGKLNILTFPGIMQV